MNETITNPKAWMESKRALGWTIQGTVRSWEPNPYGDGEIHITEMHMLDADGDFAGVLTRELLPNWEGTEKAKCRWVPFTLTAEDCL